MKRFSPNFIFLAVLLALLALDVATIYIWTWDALMVAYIIVDAIRFRRWLRRQHDILDDNLKEIIRLQRGVVPTEIVAEYEVQEGVTIEPSER